MKPAMTLAAILVAFARSAHGATIYDSYDEFYAAQSSALFGSPVQQRASLLYSDRGNGGVYQNFQIDLDGKTVHVTVAERQISIGGRIYRFSNATTFPGEHPVDIYPGSASIFFTGAADHRPSALCVEGNSSGSGESGRHRQIYLLTNPFEFRKSAAFLHLPSLLSSCRAVLATKAGLLAFPKNSYLFDDAQETRLGLLISYYTFEKRRFVPALNEVRLRFTRPEIPFQFSVQGEQ
ncbi:hypothetical protein [Burkholderia sp. Bp9099]|uniref:hypothetical protein n=1 Tax=Burkholderia sp. Bp9099 TaxID=2184568 RepID=UPI000F5DEEF5|nr:hypothetical protein [Burkholderia sp. Bp9099]RQZ46757.1 hypothetical protein DIE17_16765 [Burkholderia sp. Bp9099]